MTFRVLAAAFLLAASVSADQNDFPAASASNSLDAVGASARALAMGGAFTGLGDDASTVYFNPAGLATLKKTELGLHHQRWLADTYQEDFALALPVSSVGTLGLAMGYLDFGDFQGFDNNGLNTGSYRASRSSGRIGWGSPLACGLSAGLGFKVTQQSYEASRSVAFGADLGLLWEVDGAWRVGISYLNLGPDIGGGPQSAPFEFGASRLVELQKPLKLRLVAGGSLEASGVNRLQMGAEGAYGRGFSLRAGYRLDMASAQVPGITGLSLGLGFGLAGWVLDYAFLPYGDLGSSQRLSLVRSFEGLSIANLEAAAPAKVPILEKAPPPPAPRVKSLQFTVLPERVDRALGLEAEGKKDDAVAELKQALAENPADSAIWRALGEISFRMGNRQEVLNAFEKVLEFAPDDLGLCDWVENYRLGGGQK